MISVIITPDLDQQPWTDLRREELRAHVKDGIRIGGLPAGMVSGKASVAMILPLPDGGHVFAEMSLDLFLAAADALRTRYGENAPRGRDA